ncbi:MAG: energy-coupling factor transporter ATPase [Clostridia bacterium]|nr:energy-coupling factor transporter ATPase [Clostridia bacterium]
MNSDSYIKIENLSISYEEDDGGRTSVLKNISLDIKRGEYLAVLGHNGSGKSTLAKLLNMILEPDSGKIYIDGREITDPSMTEEDVFELRKKVGMVFQNPDNQLVATIVEDDVAFGPENLGIEPNEIRKRVDDALSVVGMSEHAKGEPARLSGGQKQRVAIAGILAMKPDCMIFDESTAMLDPLGRRDIMNTIETLNREHGITVIMITHYMDEAARANRIVVLDDGEILMDGAPAEIFQRHEELKACGLDVPQCVGLVHMLGEQGIKIEGECHTPSLCADAIAEALKKR